MSSAVDITRPIVGLATNQFIPLSDINFVFACLSMPLQCATLLSWAVLLVAIVRDRHYEELNNRFFVFFKNQSVLRRKEAGGEMSQNEIMVLTPKSKKLLKKLVLVTTTFLLSFMPLATSFVVMMATKAEVPDIAEAIVYAVFVIGLLLNPILIYLLDAKMKRSVNEILGINLIFFKKKVHTGIFGNEESNS